MAKERITARARTQYTDYLVKEPMELMEFLAAKMPQASRTKLKMLLSKRVVFVDNVITTQYNFPLKLGMKVQISRDKGNKEFHNKLLKIVYEDAYLIVIEKMQGLLSVSTERQKETHSLHHPERISQTLGTQQPGICSPSPGSGHIGTHDVCQRRKDPAHPA